MLKSDVLLLQCRFLRSVSNIEVRLYRSSPTRRSLQPTALIDELPLVQSTGKYFKIPREWWNTFDGKHEFIDLRYTARAWNLENVQVSCALQHSSAKTEIDAAVRQVYDMLSKRVFRCRKRGRLYLDEIEILFDGYDRPNAHICIIGWPFLSSLVVSKCITDNSLIYLTRNAKR